MGEPPMSRIEFCVTHLCVAIFVTDLAQAQRDIASALEAGADLIELRIDRLKDKEPFRFLISSWSTWPAPYIVTCRAAWEGGYSELTDSDRIELLKAAVPGARYVDLELQAVWRERPRFTDVALIVSAHYFQGRPDRLHNLVLEMNGIESAQVNKIVWTAKTIRDNLDAFELLQQSQKPTIALCMGEAGLISRILARKFGAFLTFASLPGDPGTAPGQISITDMKSLYRWDSIGSRTKVYGVIGNPVAHSMSPAIHNAAFDHVGHDGVYVPLLVEKGYESFKAFMETFLAFEGLDLSGLSVTIPHKENALRYLKEKGAHIDPLAERIGALNTIVIDRSDPGGLKLRGFSTDYAAILDSITQKLGINREQLADYRVAVLGAGGTGRTAVAALAHCGATVVVYNRTKEKADALAAEFNGKNGKVVAARMEKLCDSCCQIYVNTTSVGMHPDVNESPLGNAAPKFDTDTLVFDTIYNPMRTRLLEQAEAAGAKTISGVEMFLRQAAGQFEAWTGKAAPMDVMRRVIEQRLGAAK